MCGMLIIRPRDAERDPIDILFEIERSLKSRQRSVFAIFDGGGNLTVFSRRESACDRAHCGLSQVSRSTREIEKSESVASSRMNLSNFVAA